MSFVGITPGTGANISTVSLTENSQTILRQVICIGDPSNAANILNVDPVNGLLVRISGAAGALSVNTTFTGWNTGISDALITDTSVKATAGTFGGYYVFNPSATVVAYVQVHDKASSITLGTDTPKFIIAVPAGQAAHIEFTRGIAMTSGIRIAATTGPKNAVAVTTAVVASILYV